MIDNRFRLKTSVLRQPGTDLAVRGPDAFAAGLAFDRSNHPLYLYDRADAGLQKTLDLFQDLVRGNNLNAWLEMLPEQVPHRRRVNLLLEACEGAGAVDSHGLWAPAISGVPRDKQLPVMGERMPSGPDAGRWRRVWVELGQGEIAETREIGHVLVDEARLMAVDAHALGSWNDENSLDGLADVVLGA